MTISQYRRIWKKWQRQYEKRAFKIIYKGIRDSLKKIPIDKLTEDNYKRIITGAIDGKDIQIAIFNCYMVIGTIHGKRIEKEIELQVKSLFTDTYEQNVLRFLSQNAGFRIQTLSENLAKFVIKLIETGRNENETISEIVTRIVNNTKIYRWQAFRIARTESGSASNYAASLVSSQSGIVMQKVWISANDSRTRKLPQDKFDHRDMDGVRVEENEDFKVPMKEGGFERLSFPCDPKGSAGNVINCRCSTLKVVKRDANGNIIRKY